MSESIVEMGANMKKPQYILETERLKLREFTFNDSEFIIELLNSDGWLQFIGDRNVTSEDQAVNYLKYGPMKSYKENGYGLYLVEHKEKSFAIGMCGLVKRAGLDQPDVGFALLPDFTGKGYALEIVLATVAHAKTQLQISKVYAISKPGNTRSIRLLEKTGFKSVDTYQTATADEDLLLFSN